jgi:glutathione S-transferase
VRLVIGNKNYSTWSLRPWLLLDAFGVEFDEQWVSLAEPNLTERLLEYSDAARVPVLNDGELTVWDSLAICEYINDQYLDRKAWPDNSQHRATARAITAEMHAGFASLRQQLPMNCRAKRRVELNEETRRDVQRIDAIWSRYAQLDELGEWRLFGRFGIADCFFAPVVLRFVTYDIGLSDAARSYLESLLRHPSMQKWLAAALQEDEVVEQDEAGIDR